MSSQPPHGYPSSHQPSRSLHPEQVSGYSSLAQWHGGQPPLYPPQGQPAPPPQPLAHQPQPQPHPHRLHPEQVSGYSSLAQWHGGQPPLYPPQGQPVLAPAPLPTSGSNGGQGRLPGPASEPAAGAPSPNHSRNDKIGPSGKFVSYSPGQGSTRQDGPNATSTSTCVCVCGASFNGPRTRERHWQTFKCGGSVPRPAADALVLPAKYDYHAPQEVDAKWLPVLLQAFEEDPHPGRETRAELAWKMKVPRSAVDDWFTTQREVHKTPRRRLEQQKQKAT